MVWNKYDFMWSEIWMWIRRKIFMNGCWPKTYAKLCETFPICWLNSHLNMVAIKQAMYGFKIGISIELNNLPCNDWE